MKRKIIYCALVFLGCSYGERADWDSGSEAAIIQEQQQLDDVSDRTSNELPTEGPGIDNKEPF